MKIPLLAVAVLAVLSSCRSGSLTAPALNESTPLARHRPEPIGDPGDHVVLSDLRGQIRGNALLITGHAERGPRFDASQLDNLVLWIDADQDPSTGSGLFQKTEDLRTQIGPEYTVRPREREDAGPGLLVIRSTTEPGPPDPHDGGWGRVTGYAAFRESPQSFSIEIPRAALGNDDGRCRIALGFLFTEGLLGGECYILDVTGHGRRDVIVLDHVALRADRR